MRFPRRGAPFTSLMEAAVSAAHQPGLDRRPGQSFDGRQVDSHRGGRLPFPDQRDPVARDQLGRERRIPFPVAKRRGTFRGRGCRRDVFRLRSTPSNTRLTSCPTRSSRISPGCVTGIRAVGFTRRPHIRPSAGSGALRRAKAKSSGESAGCWLQGRRRNSDPSLYRRVVCSTGTWRLPEARRQEGRISYPRADRARWGRPPE